ncbi:carboxy-S-adenosyl-L-methionine synthase CmoA [bacterium]|jgi:tRNA (cmo5U34)-methyltransferase|nr:carboxy-S-adenosyl-L-methionine synthase CmoA [bacterium]
MAQSLKKDTLFQTKKTTDSFKFNEEVTEVFDDMIDRSTPFYHPLQDTLVQLATYMAQPNTAIIDLGCSTGTTLEKLIPIAKSKNCSLIGVDYSESMLTAAQSKLNNDTVQLINHDLNTPIKLPKSSLVILNLTLQFVLPKHRDTLIQSVYSALAPEGCLAVIEKTKSANPVFNQHFINIHHDTKRSNGYSDLEIAQKRDAIEDVLIPYQAAETINMLTLNGFQDVTSFFQWFNFSGFLAIKGNS